MLEDRCPPEGGHDIAHSNPEIELCDRMQRGNMSCPNAVRFRGEMVPENEGYGEGTQLLSRWHQTRSGRLFINTDDSEGEIAGNRGFDRSI